MKRPTPRAGGIFLEIVVAIGLFAIVSVPLLTSFTTGVQQTRIIRSHAAARHLAEWALNQGRAAVAEGVYAGLPRPDDPTATPLLTEDLTSAAREDFPAVTAPLEDLAVTRRTWLLPVAGGERGLYRFDIEVRWSEPGDSLVKRVRLAGLEGEEI